MNVEVSIEGIFQEKGSSLEILVLRSKSDPGKVLPIWIGSTEAQSIRNALSDSTPPERPMTHDLLETTLNFMKVRLERVVIHKMVQGTFFSHLYLNNRGTELIIDSRPSDAVALALRMKAPLYIEEAVFIKQKFDPADSLTSDQSETSR